MERNVTDKACESESINPLTNTVSLSTGTVRMTCSILAQLFRHSTFTFLKRRKHEFKKLNYSLNHVRSGRIIKLTLRRYRVNLEFLELPRGNVTEHRTRIPEEKVPSLD